MQVTDLTDYLDNGELKEIMAQQVKLLYQLGILDGSYIGLNATSVMANREHPKVCVNHLCGVE